MYRNRERFGAAVTAGRLKHEIRLKMDLISCISAEQPAGEGDSTGLEVSTLNARSRSVVENHACMHASNPGGAYNGIYMHAFTLFNVYTATPSIVLYRKLELHRSA